MRCGPVVATAGVPASSAPAVLCACAERGTPRQAKIQKHQQNALQGTGSDTQTRSMDVTWGHAGFSEVTKVSLQVRTQTPGTSYSNLLQCKAPLDKGIPNAHTPGEGA